MPCYGNVEPYLDVTSVGFFDKVIKLLKYVRSFHALSEEHTKSLEFVKYKDFFMILLEK